MYNQKVHNQNGLLHQIEKNIKSNQKTLKNLFIL